MGGSTGLLWAARRRRQSSWTRRIGSSWDLLSVMAIAFLVIALRVVAFPMWLLPPQDVDDPRVRSTTKAERAGRSMLT
jgi:hypothetical protein